MICRNVPIGRTGYMEYLGEEIGAKERHGELIKVYRSEEELFSKATMASFEGKIITNEHPPDLLTPETAQRYTKGVLHNVRRGKDETDLLLADLIIFEKNLIEEVLNGKREVSSGYDCIYTKNKDGTYSQTNIRGNHVAVVKAGRAGYRVCIKDSKNKESEVDKMSKKIQIPRKRTSTTTKFLAAIGLKHLAMDAEPEDLADVVDEMAAENRVEDEEKEVSLTDNESEAESQIMALSEKVDKLTSIVESLVQTKDEESNPEEAIDEIIENIESEDGDESEILESDDEDLQNSEGSDTEEDIENQTVSADSKAWASTLKAIKPILAAIPDISERKKACDSLIKEYKKATKAPKGKSNTYSEISKAQKRKAADSANNKAQALATHNENLGEEIARKYNANLKGGK